MSTVKTKFQAFDTQLMEEKNYWFERLSRDAGVSNLRLDYARPASYSAEKERIAIALGTGLVQKLNKVTGGSPLLIYTALLAGLNICLSKYTVSRTVIIGSPARQSNNGSSSTTNVLAIVNDVDDQLPFSAFLLKMRETLTEAYARQRYPFERILKDLGIEEQENKCALFDVALALQNIHQSMPEMRNDITLMFLKTEDGITGYADYNSKLFCRESVDRLIGHLTVVLESALADVNTLICDLSLLTEVERHQVLVRWNETRADFSEHSSIHRLFEEQVERTPEAPALLFKEELTFAELNRRANQLAHYLQRLGVGPEVRVGILMERSVEMIVALLGVLKAGGAYLPLDPAYPKERLAFMLDDAGVRVLLTQSAMEEMAAPDTQVLCFDTKSAQIELESTQNTVSNVTPANLAYVIYTSGSTGKPKGVLVAHRGLCNMVEAQVKAFRVGPASRVLQFASLSFDASVSEIFMALTTGATMFLTSKEDLSGTVLLKQLDEQAITTVTLPPALLTTLPNTQLPQLRTLIVAGESCPEDVVARWSPGRYFFNAYGPTEATVCATLFECPENYKGAPPIGRAIANTQIYLLDSHLRPVPVGVPGQLHIGGAGLARGYLNLPALTAEKFIPHPFSREGGARLYQTGDLARYLADGQIEYLGRMDHQVKVRGFRIELQEIEEVLSQHEAVKQSVVVVQERDFGEKQLVAFVVGEEGEPTTVSELRGYMRERMPEYILPQVYVIVDEFPKTPNGKIDRRALEAWEIKMSDRERSYVAPGTPFEEIMAGIWSEVLNVERVGVHDSFFQLGGHSLLATRVISRIREISQVELPLGSFFESPTIRDLAKIVETAMSAEERVQSQSIEAVPRDGELPLSFAQQRLWFLHQLEPNNTSYNLPYALRFRGQLSHSVLELTLNEIVGRHEVLRTTYKTVRGRPVQIVGPVQATTLPVTDLSSLPEPEREHKAWQMISEEALRPFDLERGPLMRASVLRLSEADHVVLFTLHHIVSDGWALGLLVREVAALYESFSAGRPSLLPELPIQYADYAAWQRQRMQGEVLEEHMSYWRERLGSELPVLELPTDKPRPKMQSSRGATENLTLDDELTLGLKELSRKEGVTLFMTLLAAFQVLLHRYSGQEDILTGTPIANRNRLETEGLIGFFVNTLVLRTDLSGDPTFSELLCRVREVALGAYAHQDLPFEKLVEELKPERDLSRQPLFQVMFALQNAPKETLDLRDVTLELLGRDFGTAMFDITLSLGEVGQELVGSLQYNTDLFEAATIKRMLGHLRTLLQAIADDPNQRLRDLPLLTPEEERLLLHEWNSTASPAPAAGCIHYLFETQAERTPEAVAVVDERQRLTYRELNEKANRLARYLRRQGVGPESKVGVMMARGVEMVVAVLGVLKAGGAYVPLDVQYPVERLRYMVEDTNVALVLMQKQRESTLDGAREVYLDRIGEEIESESAWNVKSGVVGDNLAYVIYTSGSTGKPKGVPVQHRGLCNLSKAQIHTFDLQPSNRVLQFASLSFDASIFEIVMALGVGSMLWLGSEEASLPGPNLSNLLREQFITNVTLPPTALMELREDELSTLRTIIVAGEPCPAELAERWSRNRRFFNAYGPTEATVWSTVAECSGDNWKPTIGRAIANTQIYLLDSHLRPVPVGVPGQLHIGGAGLARGYLNLPALTAEKFIPHPFSREGGARLYQTGDLARYLADGQIEYLGRMDHQVKVRGFRIELQEIEEVLSSHTEVRQCLVMARESGAGEKRLVAYVEVDPASGVASNELRSFLQQKLPEYMVPATYVRMEKFPLLSNGKVNRRALPAPDQSRPDLEIAYVAPRTPLEQTLADIWSKVLDLGQVGVNDNFFDLGGHSLAAVRAVFDTRDALQLDIPVRLFFETPTVAGIAQAIETGQVRTAATLDLRAEAVLDPDISPRNATALAIAEPKNIFLTGATGFLGAYLLRDLLQQTEADIHCLVRASDYEEGKQRIQRSLESYMLWDESQGSRIIPVVGDMSKPLLGLTAQEFDTLAGLIDVIYHSGALVNFLYPYSVMKAANVLGTQEVLRLASRVQIKPVHYVSTMSVFTPISDSEVKVIGEENEPNHPEALPVGYAQSKWVAEKLVKLAHERGLPVRIYRPGAITGDSQTGVTNVDDFWCRYIKGCVELGSIPGGDWEANIVPVDYLSRAIVHLSRQKEAAGLAHNVIHPQPVAWSKIIQSITSFGYPLREMPYAEWRELLKSSPQNPLYSLMITAADETEEEQEITLDTSRETVSYAKKVVFNNRRTIDDLAGASIVFPPLNYDLFSTYLSFLTRCDFLKAPAQSTPNGRIGAHQ